MYRRLRLRERPRRERRTFLGRTRNRCKAKEPTRQLGSFMSKTTLLSVHSSHLHPYFGVVFAKRTQLIFYRTYSCLTRYEFFGWVRLVKNVFLIKCSPPSRAADQPTSPQRSSVFKEPGRSYHNRRTWSRSNAELRGSDAKWIQDGHGPSDASVWSIHCDSFSCFRRISCWRSIRSCSRYVDLLLMSASRLAYTIFTPSISIFCASRIASA